MDIGAWLKDMTGLGAASPDVSTPAPQSNPAPSTPIQDPPSAAPRSAAAAALAAYAATPGVEQPKPAKKEPNGVALKLFSDSFDISTQITATPEQLQVAPITVLKTDYREQVLHQISCNSTYICYGLKAGHIRALNKENANRALFKGHTVKVADMQFSSPSSNVLASVDVTGHVFIRRLSEGDGGGTVQEEVLAHHQLLPCTKGTRRLSWHPQSESLLAVAEGDRVCFINVAPTAAVAAASPEFATPSRPEEPHAQGSLTCIAFSPAGDFLAASDDTGRVYVWAIPPDMLAAQQVPPLTASPSLVFTAFPPPASYPSCVAFLPSASPQHSLLVVGDATARCLQLWTLTRDAAGGGLGGVRTYEFEFRSSSEGPDAFFNHMLVQPDFSAVVLGNTKKQQVYVLHARQDAATGHASFDYISTFAVKMPILSMTTVTENMDPQGQPGSVSAEVFQLYCVQTEAIQQYTLYPEACFPQEDLEEEEQRQSHAEAPSQAFQPPETAPIIPPTVHTPLAPRPLPQTPEEQPAQQPSSIADGSGAKEVQEGAQPPATASIGEPESSRSAPSPPPPPSARLMSMLSKGGATSTSPTPSQAAGTSQAVSNGGAAVAPPTPAASSKPEADGGASDQAVRGTNTTATVSSGGFGADSGLTGTFLDDLVAMARKGSAGTPTPPLVQQAPARVSQPQPAPRQAPQPAPTASDITQIGSHRLGMTGDESDDSVTSPGPGEAGRRRGGAAGRGRSAGGKGAADGSAGVSSDGSSEAATAAGGTTALQQAPGPHNLSRQNSSSGAVPKAAPAEQQQQGPAPAPSIAAEERVAAAAAAAAGALAALSELVPPVNSIAEATGAAGHAAAVGGAGAGGKQRGGKGSAPVSPPVGLVQGNNHPAGAGGGVDASHLEQLLSQVLAGQKEVLKAIKAEAKTSAKATETAVTKAVESALKASEKRQAEEVSRAVQAATTVLSRDLASKLAETQRLISATVTATVRSALAEALPSAAQQAVEKSLSNVLRNQLPHAVGESLRECFASGVVPAFERATQVMFGQIESAFNTGLTQQLTTASTSSEAAAASLKASAAEVSQLLGSMRSEVAALKTTGAQVAAVLKRAEAGVGAGKAAGAAGSAAAAPPAPVPKDPKVIIAEHLSSRRLNAAFEAALSSGMDTLMWLLRQTSPSAVFSQDPCPLSQACMLSLLSYLAHDLTTDTELKLKWIAEAAPCIDPAHPEAAPHTRTVLEPIKASLAPLAKSSGGEIGKTAKMAVHVVNSLLHQ